MHCARRATPQRHSRLCGCRKCSQRRAIARTVRHTPCVASPGGIEIVTARDHRVRTGMRVGSWRHGYSMLSAIGGLFVSLSFLLALPFMPIDTFGTALDADPPLVRCLRKVECSAITAVPLVSHERARQCSQRTLPLVSGVSSMDVRKFSAAPLPAMWCHRDVRNAPSVVPTVWCHRDVRKCSQRRSGRCVVSSRRWSMLCAIADCVVSLGLFELLYFWCAPLAPVYLVMNALGICSGTPCADCVVSSGRSANIAFFRKRWHYCLRGVSGHVRKY
ncbi:unnamed protein product, partial [Mesorhabditis spiculigera]